MIRVFDKIFNDAIEWIKKAAKPAGWGESRVDASVTLVNIAEATLALFFAGVNENYLKRAIKLLQQAALKSLKAAENGVSLYSYKGFTREICWAGIALSETCGDQLIISSLISHLKKNQNDDGGWGPKKGVESNTFSTSLALWFLSYSESKEKSDAIKWLYNNFRKYGWGWSKKEEPNPAATAYALIALKKSDVQKNHKIELALQYLERAKLETISGPPTEVVRGMTLYRHFTLAWVIVALLLWERKVDVRKIRELLSLRVKEGPDKGGFRDKEGEHAKIWATMQAIFALKLFSENLKTEDILSFLEGRESIRRELHKEIKQKEYVSLFEKFNVVASPQATLFLYLLVLYVFLTIFVFATIFVRSVFFLRIIYISLGIVWFIYSYFIFSRLRRRRIILSELSILLSIFIPLWTLVVEMLLKYL